VAETRVKRLLCCGFRHTGKAMGISVSILVEDMLGHAAKKSAQETRRTDYNISAHPRDM
jgi:hypothetical protein